MIWKSFAYADGGTIIKVKTWNFNWTRNCSSIKNEEKLFIQETPKRKKQRWKHVDVDVEWHFNESERKICWKILT